MSSNNQFECSLCGHSVPMDMHFDHIIECCPVNMMTTWHPLFSTWQLFDMLIGQHADFMEDTDDMTYEQLTQLCDDIGYHEVGLTVDQINQHAPIVTQCAGSEQSCPVCLEQVPKNQTRRVAGCGHEFCAECIETWLAKHTTCPVCKCDVSDQIASTSASLSLPTTASPSMNTT